MALSNTAVPKYYGRFRDAVIQGKIPVNKNVSMYMNIVDRRIEDPRYYYDPVPVEGWIKYCEAELTLTDGSDQHMLDSFKLWGEDVFGWYEYVSRSVWIPGVNGEPGHYEIKRIKQRLINVQYLIVGRSAAKSVYETDIQAYFLNIDPTTTHQITTAPTMKQADEVMSTFKTAITRSKGPLFKFLTSGSMNNTTGSKIARQKLASTKLGIQNFLSGSLLEVRPMSIDKLQGLRCKIATVDEWLSGELRESPFEAIEQGAAKIDDYLIVGVSSEGTVRNGIGDTIKMELTKILKGEWENPHISIWWYCLDDIKEVNDPNMWLKANPNIGITVKWDTYQRAVEKAEHSTADRNDILAKRFGIPMEGYTYFFNYEDTLVHRYRNFYGMPCALGADLSQGNDFCAFTFLFPLKTGEFGVKALSYISERTFENLPLATRQKYQEFIDEGSLMVLNGVTIDLDEVYEDVDKHIIDENYDVRCFGYDPYNAQTFVERWTTENGPFGVVKVIQGSKTETVPLGELRAYAEERMLLFYEKIMQYTMGNAVVITDTNGNMKLMKKRYEQKIDNVSAMMDAYVAYKANKESFE